MGIIKRKAVVGDLFYFRGVDSFVTWLVIDEYQGPGGKYLKYCRFQSGIKRQ